MDCVLHPGLTLLGYLALSYLLLTQLYTLLRGVRVHILSRWWRKDLREYGGWAVVTGATDGIGKSYAHELAKRGFNVVILSRTLEKLQKVAEEIEQQSGRKVKIVQADFTGGEEIYSQIEEALKDLDIGILVNNVGMAFKGYKCFLDVSDLSKGITDMLNCNAQSMLQMTRIVLPRMVVRKKGLIINISSGLGAIPFPRYSLYCGTKACMDFFTRSLSFEYSPLGIDVQSVMPLAVSTNMSGNVKANLLVKTSDDFAREALNTVGLTHRNNGCLVHAIQMYLLDLIFTDYVIGSRIFVWIARTASRAFARRQKLQ
ncbi:very-long-chain 3-oxoacyl-CoA reductase-B-like [Hyperolius riggenbachi]|uniref:very-long-chain 3-oxoacyl-CoA reductase-B-like n=1 Tax=Hyperolius riggenbachi TaxID=752182 RepID=UPI0035A2EB3F